MLLDVLLKRARRELFVRGAFFLPADRRRAIERRLRGAEEKRKLDLADAVVCSYGKAGRTWLRVMISRAYGARWGLPETMIMGFDNMHARAKEIPRILFTHDNYLKDYTGNADSKADYYGKTVVLLTRDPRDTAVSQFFQWKHRMRKSKKALNDYPDHGADLSVDRFLLDDGRMIEKICAWMNLWAAEADRIGALHIVRYEDLRRDPEGELSRIMAVLGGGVEAAHIKAAVAFASVENMRAMEAKGAFWRAGSRMKTADKSNPDAYKVRRAKVGGWRDYMDDAAAAAVDARVNEILDPRFGYSG